MATRGCAARFDRVLDHVGEHLDGDLTLEALAGARGVAKRASTRSLTEIALEVGFPALSDLPRAFKATYGVPPSAWDRASPPFHSPDVRALQRNLDAHGIQLANRADDGTGPAFAMVLDPDGNPILFDQL